MPRYILICEATQHACPVTRQEATRLLDIRFNPEGGWTNVEKTLALLEATDQDGIEVTGKRQHYAVPFILKPMGKHSLHVQELMDMRVCGGCRVLIKREDRVCLRCGAAQKKPLVWKQPGHRCDVRCLIAEHHPQEIQGQFGYRGKAR